MYEEITPARPDEWPAAFALAYQRTPTAVRQLQVAQALELTAAGVIDPAGIWIARNAGGVAAVQVAVPLGGASFLFWLPETRGPLSIIDPLVQAVLQWCNTQGAKLGQALAPPSDAERAAPLVRHGFQRVTQLWYLEHDLRDPPAPYADPIRCQPVTAASEPSFRATLARTYEGTLDCPELNGVRTVDEILAGYRAASAGRPERWWLIHAAGEPAGVMIVTELPDGPVWDLSYLGVVPDHRRRGIGAAAVRLALAWAYEAGAAQMVLAVDQRNEAARHLYGSLGFIEAEARDVYLRLF